MNLCWKLWIYLTLKVRVQNFPNQTRRSRDVCSAETNFVNVFVSSLLPLMCNFFPVKILGFSLASRSTFDIYYHILKQAVGFFKWYCNWKKIIIFKKTYIYVVLLYVLAIQNVVFILPGWQTLYSSCWFILLKASKAISHISGLVLKIWICDQDKTTL